jgi:hypothetical protein
LRNEPISYQGGFLAIDFVLTKKNMRKPWSHHSDIVHLSAYDIWELAAAFQKYFLSSLAIMSWTKLKRSPLSMRPLTKKSLTLFENETHMKLDFKPIPFVRFTNLKPNVFADI